MSAPQRFAVPVAPLRHERHEVWVEGDALWVEGGEFLHYVDERGDERVPRASWAEDFAGV